MLRTVNETILGPVVLILLLLCGIYFLITCMRYMIRHPKRLIKGLYHSQKKGGIRATCLALAGTLGVGNIAGVCSAIALGGPGTLFWMWICGILAMGIKYAEVTTALTFRYKGQGGAPYYIKEGLHSTRYASLAALLILFCAFTVGSSVQSSAGSMALRQCFGLDKYFIGIISSGIVLYLLSGGGKKITSFTLFLIPLITLFYIILCLIILIKFGGSLPSVMKSVIDDALSPGACASGGACFLLNRGMYYGAVRGILSNEAGCGTSTFAHAETDNLPVEQGFFGMVEVFVDTLLLCTMTGLVFLVISPGGNPTDGMSLALSCFRSIGKIGAPAVAISSALFAIGSIVCWGYYAELSLAYLTGGNKANKTLRLFLCLSCFIGCTALPDIIWELSDLSINLLLLCNLWPLLRLSPSVIRSTAEYFGGNKRKDRSR